MSLSSDPFGSNFDDLDSYGEGRKPPTYLLYVGVASVLAGFSVGVYGFQFALTNSQQLLTGGIGYICCAVFPITILLVMHAKHEAATRDPESDRYDSYAGNRLSRIFLRRVVSSGLFLSSLPVWVFLTPIAQSIQGAG